MAGKQCNGGTFPATRTRQSKAFCEGRKANVDGELVTVNPHPDPSEAFACWEKGWNSVAGTAASLTCCAV